MAGAAVVCPFCRVTIPPPEVAEGWCESCGKRIPQFALSEAGAKVVDRVSVPKPLRQPRSSPFRFRLGIRYIPTILLLTLAALQIAEGLGLWLAVEAPRMKPRAERREETLVELVAEIPVSVARSNLYMRLVAAALCVGLAIGALRWPLPCTLPVCLYLPIAAMGIIHGIQHGNIRERNWESAFAVVIVAAVVVGWVFEPPDEDRTAKTA